MATVNDVERLIGETDVCDIHPNINAVCAQIRSHVICTQLATETRLKVRFGRDVQHSNAGAAKQIGSSFKEEPCQPMSLPCSASHTHRVIPRNDPVGRELRRMAPAHRTKAPPSRVLTLVRFDRSCTSFK